jgi:glycosyltransferase involved in cell wall biosynthesis
MAEGPRVTVVIPTWNRAALVGEAIDSVLRQTYRDFEIVVCDDGSTDDTPARVAAFGPPVRYLRHAHTGRCAPPRNRGIEAAKGELVAFLDDDDLWEPQKLARQIELIDGEGLDLVYTNRRFQFSDGSPSVLAVTPAPVSPDRLLDVVLDGQFPTVCTVLVRRTLLHQVEGFDETLDTGEDLDLWLRLGPIARAGRMPEPLVIVRRRAGSLSDRRGLATYGDAIGILERFLATGELAPSQRRLGRATLARLGSRLATELAAQDDRTGAVRAALGALRYAPTGSTAWAALAKALRP